MRVLIADNVADSVARRLEDDGHEVGVDPTLDGDSLVDAIRDVEVLVVRSTKVTEQAIDAAERLQLVVRAGAGVNTIDIDAAAARGIYVCNVPGRNAIAVAELTIGLILALDRNLPDNVIELRNGHWDKRRFSQARGVYGRALGILGCGDIGLEVAERAHAFGLEVLVTAKDRDPAREQRLDAIDARRVDRDTLLAESDIVTFHVPATDDTRAMVDAELLGKLKQGAWIINTSRGEIVDEDALLEALDDEERDLRAALDVYRDEPAAKEGTFDSPLARHPRVYGTHHIGASTDQAQEAIADGVVSIVRDLARGEVGNVVNLETRPTGSTTLNVRHLDRVGVLSGVLRVLREADINVGEMVNRIFAGEEAAVATMQVSGEVTDEVVEQIRAVEHVLHVSAVPTPT
ncbi:MAG: phosphoglycerate dehydrogenase [Nitriliruptorales bacterium]|nr:phosphoglycerate dehydrogenase [Nitriliruptorales bacterium]